MISSNLVLLPSAGAPVRSWWQICWQNVVPVLWNVSTITSSGFGFHDLLLYTLHLPTGIGYGTLPRPMSLRISSVSADASPSADCRRSMMFSTPSMYSMGKLSSASKSKRKAGSMR